VIALFADGLAVYWLREFKISVHPYENMYRSLFDALVARLTIHEEVFRPCNQPFEETIDSLMNKAAPGI
jgi:hypothetical protein